MNVLDKVKQYVDGLFGKNSTHLERTLYWVKQLKPDADEALLIAAYSHDIERAFRPTQTGANFLLQREAMVRHQEEGGQRMYEFLINIGCDEQTSSKVKELISHHEDGGTVEADILKDADSISYFETSVNVHLGWLGKYSKEDIKRKFDFMFERISSTRASKFATPLYANALNALMAK